MQEMEHSISIILSPNRAPTARLALLSSSWLTAAKALKMSGAPLPSARRVTPATFWLSLRMAEMTVKAGQKLGEKEVK